MKLFAAPYKAFQLLIKSPSLLALAFLPGAVALLLTVLSLLFAWQQWLGPMDNLWLSIPIILVLSPIFWIAFGNLAIIPIEDTIIDKVQLAVWNEVRIPSTEFHMKRMLTESVYSLSLTLFFLFLLLISFIPGLVILSYLAASWAIAWSFLAAYYARKSFTLRQKLKTFFSSPFTHFLLGAFLNLLLFIPIVNVWLLGYALILSTLVAMEQETSS